jgi:uncharacterized protein (TIGR03084 family)
MSSAAEPGAFTQVADFRDESLALHDLVAGLDDQALARSTQFKGWTIDDVLRHLHVWNRAADMSLAGDPGFDDFLGHVRTTMAGGGSLGAFEAEWLGDIRGAELRTLWRDFVLDMCGRFDAADPKARVRWAGPDMSVRSSITARLMETWAHGQAVYDLLGCERVDADRIRNIAVLGVNTYQWTFANRGLEPPGPLPHVRLTAPSGDTWTWGEKDSVNLVEGSATGFCQTVTQTRNVADTDIRTVGETARQWMAFAQCFAGPPEDPPAPGTRFVQ